MQVISYYKLLKESFLNELGSNKTIEYGSVLHGLFNSIQFQLNELKISLDTVSSNNGLFTQFGSRLDEIGLIVGAPRNIEYVDSEDVLNSQIILKTVDGKSLASKILTTYSSINEFINTEIYVIDSEGNQFKLIMPQENPEIVFQSSTAILSAQPTTIITKFIDQDTQLFFTQFGNQISQQILAYTQRSINLNKSYEDDYTYRYRIQNTINSRYQFTPSGLQNLIFNSNSQIRSVYVDDKARGVGTVDVYVFPVVANVYDENGNFLVGSTFIEDIKKQVADLLPVGIDISILEAEKKIIKQELDVRYISNNQKFSEDDQIEEIKQLLREIILNTEPGGTVEIQNVLYSLIQQTMNLYNNENSQLYLTTVTFKDIKLYYEQTINNNVTYTIIDNSYQLEPYQYAVLGDINISITNLG